LFVLRHVAHGILQHSNVEHSNPLSDGCVVLFSVF
jgi:hypothetical protein